MPGSCGRSLAQCAMRLVNHPFRFRLDSQRLLSYLKSMRVLTFAVTPANPTVTIISCHKSVEKRLPNLDGVMPWGGRRGEEERR